MLNKESDARMIGYGAMLMEGVVGIVALIASCSLFPGDYFAINLSPEKFTALGIPITNLAELSREVGETVAGRPGGAVSLAVGFAQIFTGIPGMKSLMAYWYHFAIMFEALFILTTIDAGTRISRFLVQEFVGKLWKPMGKTDWIPGTLISTTVVVYAWAYFIWNGSISTIWPMFGTANQLLAGVALAVASSAIINAGKVRYVWVTLIPMLFVTITTLVAGWESIFDNYLPLMSVASTATQGIIDTVLTAIIMLCAVVILAEASRRWYRVLVKGELVVAGNLVQTKSSDFSPPDFGCC